MNPTASTRLLSRKLLLAFIVPLALAIAPRPLSAAFTWDGGGGNNNWTTNNNWNPNGAPAAGTLNDFIFGGTTRTTNSANGATPWEVNSLTFNNNAGAFVISGTTLKLQSGGVTNNDTQTQTINNALALQATATFNANSGAITLGGIISGASGLTKTGNSTLTLNGGSANTFTGTTTISAGTLTLAKTAGNAIAGTVITLGDGSGTDTLRLGASNQINDAAALTFTSGGTPTFNLATFSERVGSIASTNTSATITVGGGTLTVGDATDTSFAGTITGTSGKLTKEGTGTLVLSGSNSYTGVTTINAGTLAAAANNALGTAGGATTVNSGGTLGFQGGINYSTTESVTITGTGAAGSSGAIDNISGTNTFAGPITVSANAQIGTTGGALTLSGALNLSAGASTDQTLTFNVADATSITASGKISDELNASFMLGVTQLGNGTLTLSNGTNNYWGNTTIGTAGGTTTGTLALGANNALPTINNASAINIYSGTLDLNNFNATAAGTVALGGGGAGSTAAVTTGTGTLTLGGNVSYDATNNANGATIAGNLALGSTRTFTVNDSSAAADDLTVTAAVSGSTFGITKAGAGTMVLSGTNTYSGTTTVNAGTLRADGSASLGATTGNVTVTAGTLALAGGAAITAGSPTNAETITKSGLLTLSGAGAGASTGALHAAGATGATSQWLGNISLSGNATISAADNLLIIGNGTSYNNTIALGANTLTLNTTSATGVVPEFLNFPGFTLDSSNILINSAISGTGGLVKDGAGTVTMLAYPNNTYSGATVINDGRLIIGGDPYTSIISSASVTVGDNSGVANSAVLQMGFLASPPTNNDLIGTSDANSGVASTSMTVNADGFFDLNGGSNGLVNLTLAGGHVGDSYLSTGQSSLLSITGGISSTGSAQAALINNWKLAMEGADFGVAVANGAAATDLQIDAILVNGVGFTNSSTANSLVKSGAGTLLLTAANSYQGITSIQGGVLAIQHSAALGQVGSSGGDTTNGTVVATGAQLQLDGSGGNLTIGDETLTLNGTGAGGTGALLNAAGTNTYNGRIRLETDSRINAETGSSLTIASASGAGATIITGNTAGRTLTVGGAGNISVNSVVASNIGTLVKDGTGTFTLAGDYAANAVTTVQSGTMVLNMGGSVSRGLTSATAVTIGDGIGAAGSATLLLAQSNQIADNAAVSLGADGRFNVNSQAETVGSIAGSGQILLGTGQLIAGGSNASTTFSGTLAGDATSSLTKAGSGTLTISSNLNATAGDFAGTLNLTGGTLAFDVSNAFTGTVNVSAGTTLRLSDATLNIASLNLTGSGAVTLDFAGTASVLNVTNLSIAASVTLNIINWQDAADYFFAANWSGAELDLRGAAPMNQVVFNSPTWVGNDTKWQGYDKQITPVPEPSTYGALLLGSTVALLGWRRRRQGKTAQAR